MCLYSKRKRGARPLWEFNLKAPAQLQTIALPSLKGEITLTGLPAFVNSSASGIASPVLARTIAAGSASNGFAVNRIR